MLQRLQSLYLLIAALLLLPVHFFAIWTVSYGNLSNDDITNDKFLVSEHLLADLPLLASIAILVISIFLFKNYKLQRRVIEFGVGFMVMFGLACYYIIGNLKSPIYSIISQDYQVVIILPLAAITLVVLAYLRILKDEALVKSLDRLI